VLKRLLKSWAGTAEIVGTVLFLVILFFFFSNVFLWHNQVTQGASQVVADKMNSSIRIESVLRACNRAYYTNQFIDEEYDSSHDIYTLDQSLGFNTGMDTPEKIRLVFSVHLAVNASWYDSEGEACRVYIYDKSGQWLDTGLRVERGFRWLNLTLSQGNRYIDSSGVVHVKFRDSTLDTGVNDTAKGELSISYMEVVPDVVALEVTDSGGVDATLSRLWIVSGENHTYIDLESRLVACGSCLDIVFGGELPDPEAIVINYAPPAGQTVIFKAVTSLGNIAACSIDFPPD
jgi:hypothetical protein